jgi:hypothetical protein
VQGADERGIYRLSLLPPGNYQIQADLSGFAPAEAPAVELLVGQSATLPFTMKISVVRENVTVTGETPLIDVTSTQVAGNVDRRQMESMPLQGRNWLELSMLVKGITANNMTNNPGISQNESFNLNLDGQQIKSNDLSSGSGEPHFSREAIAEFQVVTNQFDITQGRSTGVQVQAISKSGSNNLSGVGYGFFRSDKFNAADPVALTVLPYQDQQAGFSSAARSSRTSCLLVRAREQSGHRVRSAAAARHPEPGVRQSDDAEQLSGPRRLAPVAEPHPVAALIALGVLQSVCSVQRVVPVARVDLGAQLHEFGGHVVAGD